MLIIEASKVEIINNGFALCVIMAKLSETSPSCIDRVITWAVHKKSLFSVQRVVVIVASRAAPIYLFFHFFLFGKKIVSTFGKNVLLCKNEKKSPGALFKSPGRSTGNRFFL